MTSAHASGASEATVDGPLSKRPKLGAAVAADSVITFHLLKHTPEGLAVDENGSFPPEMCHQLFGEEEEIRGYDGLSIDIWVTPRLVFSVLRLQQATVGDRQCHT